MGDPNMTDIEPTNGELMRAIGQLREDQLRVEVKLDVLRQDLAQLGADVKVHEAQDSLQFAAAKQRADAHDLYHERKETAIQEAEKLKLQEEGNRALRGQLVVMALTFVVGCGSFFVGVFIH